MPYCNAFDRFNSPCMSEIPEGSDVCAQHVHFYGPTWFDRFPFAPEPNPRLFFFSSSSKIKAIYTRAILEGRVKVSKEHIKRIEEEFPNSSEGVDYYLLCCMQADVDPISSTRFFTQAVKNILDCHSLMVYQAVQADPYILTRFLSPLLNTRQRSFSSMVCHILYSAYRLTTSADMAKNIDKPLSLLAEIKSHPKFTSEFLWEHSESEEKLVNMLLYSSPEPDSVQYKIKQFFMNMKSLRKGAQERQKASFTEKKEKIMEFAWTPERFTRWCLDTEEMKRFLQYSNTVPATTENQRKPL